MTEEKILGILGGMGPEATVELMRRIVEKTPAKLDSDHIRCIVDQNAKVPSRPLSIQGKIPSAAPALIDMGKRLQNYGANILCMPCNTAHFYLPDIEKEISIPFIDMLACTAKHIQTAYPNEKRVGIASTTNTKDTKLYDERFATLGIEAVYPKPGTQEKILTVIAAVKAGNIGKEIQDEMKSIVTEMREQGIYVVVIACTELSVVSPDAEGIIDALDCLVAEIIYQTKGLKI